MSARLASILFMAGLLAQTLHAQPTVNDDTIDGTFGAEGITLETAIEWASNSTDRPFQFKDTDFRSADFPPAPGLRPPQVLVLLRANTFELQGTTP